MQEFLHKQELGSIAAVLVTVAPVVRAREHNLSRRRRNRQTQVPLGSGNLRAHYCQQD